MSSRSHGWAFNLSVSADPESRRFYHAAGCLFMIWGNAEGNIARMLHRISRSPDCSPYFPKGIVPGAFDKKKDIWKSLFSEVDWLEPAKPRALAVIKTLERAQALREKLAHGLWQGIIPGPPISLKVLCYKVGKVNPTFSVHRIRLDKLVDEIERANKLQIHFLSLTLWLEEAIHKQRSLALAK